MSTKSLFTYGFLRCALIASLFTGTCLAVWSDDALAAPRSPGFLGGLTTVTTVASTIPANRDENHYAVAVASVSAGAVHEGDVPVDNFNAKSNKQDTGSTIVDVSPSGKMKLFAAIPHDLRGCPGGVGLTTAMTILSTGWVLVGSAPSTSGSTATAGAGCLIVISPSGHAVSTSAGPDIDGPRDVATLDQGTTATLFLTNTLIGVASPGQAVVHRGDLVRVTLRVPTNAAPTVTKTTVIASGFAERASANVFVNGPTGVAHEGATAYVADPLTSSITAVSDAVDRTSSDGTGRTVISRGFLRHPIAMVTAPNGDLLVANGLNGDLVEVTTTGRQVARFAVDPDPAASPAGSGDLFGLAVAANDRGVYFVKDGTNALSRLRKG